MKDRRPYRSFVLHPAHLVRALAAGGVEAQACELEAPPLPGGAGPMAQLAQALSQLAATNGLPVPRQAADRPPTASSTAPLGRDEAVFLARLLALWGRDPLIDELYMIPGVKILAAGHRRHPGTARHELLVELGQLPPATWVGIRELVDHLSAVAPLIYRPLRDEQNWRVRGEIPGLGQVDDGSFRAVEGSWAVYVIATCLTLFGAVALGFDRSGRLDCFRLTNFGKQLLSEEPEPQWTPEQENWLVVQPNFEILVPLGADARIDEEVATFSRLVGGDAYRIYRLQPHSLVAAFMAGMTPAAVLAALTALSRGAIPQNVRYEIEQWGATYGAIRLSPAVLLECRDPHVLSEFLHHQSLRGRVTALSKTSAVVAASAVRELSQSALERSMLPEIRGVLLRTAAGLWPAPSSGGTEAGDDINRLAAEIEGIAVRLRLQKDRAQAAVELLELLGRQAK
ncbi:MAG: helicase-associated domain-containing protein [Candidatus Schekmanbacteria bacterium]|nr:helicase-associated domain-containing protein [Candidatus Schekmanbacteria bacterium]